MKELLPTRPAAWARRQGPEANSDDAARRAAAAIIDDVRSRGGAAVRHHGERLGDRAPGDRLLFDAAAQENAYRGLDDETRALLGRVAGRIEAFARAQRRCFVDLQAEIPGGRGGHTLTAVPRAGCYAPGGRYPLPSSVLMTAVTARAAGVEEVWLATPSPAPIMLAAAHVAGVRGTLVAGGAQAVAALAFGCEGIPPCEVVVGPGNRYVTAAKEILAGRVRIDLLGGPSELVILADDTADPRMVAADLLSQAEHDPESVVALVTCAEGLAANVRHELHTRIASLPTRETALPALRSGAAVELYDLAAAIAVINELAPEHLQVMTGDAAQVARRCRFYGALFIGPLTSQVLGDYGAGPNHVLPTGGSARGTGGLSVLNFLAARTWMKMDLASADLFADAIRLARLEGLEGHARALEIRSKRIGTAG